MNLSIKSVPEEIVERLRQRANRNHRSLQGELMSILEEALRKPAALSPDQVLAVVRRLGLTTPDEAAAMVRDDRDGRQGR